MAASRRHRLILGAAAGATAAGVAALARIAGADDRWTFDHDVRAWLGDRHRAQLHRVLDALGHAGTVGVYLPATLLAAGAVARTRGRMQALPVLGALGAAVLAHSAIKHAVGRERPPRAIAEGNRRPSFPSGHTTRATAVAGIVGYALVRERLAPRRAVLPLAVAAPILVGASRVYGDRHWATDVAGGWGLGGAIFALSALWYERVRRHDVRRSAAHARGRFDA